MCVDLFHCCFHGAKSIVINPSSCHLIDFRNLSSDRSRHFPASQFFQSAFEFLYRILMWSALPLVSLAVLEKTKAEIFQLLRSCDTCLGHVDL